MELIEITSWSDFKALVANKKLLMQYEDSAEWYRIFAPEASAILWKCAIAKGSEDADDFEDNFKSAANAPLEIKGTAGKPSRVSPSAQPIGTTEIWKGYHADNNSDNVFYFDIEFDTDVWLRGGRVHCDEAVCGESIVADIVLKSDNTVVKAAIIDSIYIAPGHQVEFMSEESLLLPSYLKLRVKYTKGQSQTSARCVTAVAQFFKPDA